MEEREIIEVKDLCKIYESAGGTVHAIDDLSFGVSRGEFFSIVGPSGCGKSTLIRIIGDLIEPTSGRVTVAGLKPKEARLEGMFSYVFQKPVLLPWRRVIDNIRLPLEVLNEHAARHKTRRPDELLRMVGLTEFANSYPQELSGGMQHRVALARALTYAPEVLFMDEPFAAIDEFARNALNQELLRIWRELKVTILYITHSLIEAVFLSSRILVLSPRPARVKGIIEVPFSDHREESLKETSQFQEVVRCLREKLESAN
jgi:NitT/TauT family transport system ATP-binding protein